MVQNFTCFQDLFYCVECLRLRLFVLRGLCSQILVSLTLLLSEFKSLRLLNNSWHSETLAGDTEGRCHRVQVSHVCTSLNSYHFHITHRLTRHNLSLTTTYKLSLLTHQCLLTRLFVSFTCLCDLKTCHTLSFFAFSSLPSYCQCPRVTLAHVSVVMVKGGGIDDGLFRW